MIQLKLTEAQFQDLFNSLFEAERSCALSAKNSKRIGADNFAEDLYQESIRYKELRRFITDTREVI